MPAQPGPAGAGADALQFSDAASFQVWRARLPLANATQCHAALAVQARALARATLPAAALLELLELLRETAVAIQAGYAKKYRGSPVPLDDDDRAAWDSVVGVWSSLAAGYDALIDAMAGAAPEMAAHAALICQRAVRYTGLAMSEHNRVYRKIPGVLWQQLHRLYRFAENAGATEAVVHDELDRATAATSCAAAYLHALLMQLAQPDALNAQQMDAVDRWLDAWETLASLSPAAPPAGAIPPIAVDLASDKGAGLASEMTGTDVRHVNLENMSRALRQAAAGLRQGQTPAQLGLGTLAREACEKLLMLLHVQWCAAGTGRVDERSAGGIIVTILPNLAAIHYNLTGRAFRQPGGEITARERQDIDLLGYVSEATDRAMVSQRSAAVETWVIVNKSASGFLGMCRDLGSATRIGHNQLLGLRNPSNKNLYLGTVQRLIVDEAGGIWVGLRLITANPQAAAARNSAARGPEAVRYDRALLLPGDPARKVPASVLLQPGWYAANRQIDLQTDKRQKIQLQSLLDKGPNFDRATFTAA